MQIGMKGMNRLLKSMEGMNRLLEKLKHVPFASAALVIVNIIVFLICTFTGDLLYNRYGVDRWSIAAGREFIRLVSAMFLHADVQHLFNNMIILFFLGYMLEMGIGHIRFTLIYFLSGIAGNVLSVMVKVITLNDSVSVGASGAIFGMDGLLLSLVLFSKRYRTMIPRVILMIVLSLYSGFTGGNVDNAAHVGGLIAGFLSGAAMCLIERGRRKNTISER